jgi:hypothetical protein
MPLSQLARSLHNAPDSVRAEPLANPWSVSGADDGGCRGHPEIAVQGGIDRQAIEPPFSATTRWTWNLPRRKGRGIIERGMRESQPTPSMQG